MHLQGARTDAPKSSDLENMYIDIGATSSAEVRKAGVAVLNPIAMNRQPIELGYNKMAGASIGDRFGAAALVDLLRQIDPSKVKGTLTIAFVVQQWTGARGLQRILSTMKPDEMIYVGRLTPGGAVAGSESMHRAPRREPGSGILIGLEETNGMPAGLAAELKQLADANKLPINTDFSASPVPRSYLPLAGNACEMGASGNCHGLVGHASRIDRHCGSRELRKSATALRAGKHRLCSSSSAIGHGSSHA